MFRFGGGSGAQSLLGAGQVFCFSWFVTRICSAPYVGAGIACIKLVSNPYTFWEYYWTQPDSRPGDMSTLEVEILSGSWGLSK